MKVISEVFGEIKKPSLKQVTWVFEQLNKHLNGSGTYRYLIYDRLGFGPEAYVPLYEAGGMAISNALFEVYESNKKEITL